MVAGDGVMETGGGVGGRGGNEGGKMDEGEERGL